MNEHSLTDSPIDRNKRPRFEDVEADSDTRIGKEDRHSKRQAMPDPESKVPHFTGVAKKDACRRNKECTESDQGDDDTNGDSGALQVLSNMDSLSGVVGGDGILNLKYPYTNISLRSLVSSVDAGIIIGRAGKNVNQIRQNSSSRITVSDIVHGVYERILTIDGSVEAVAKAYSMVCEMIIAKRSSVNQEIIPNIQLLIPDMRMGSLIGRHGTIIKSIQEESGAYINASEEILDMSTEQILSMTGAPKSIYIAVARVGDILAGLSQRSLPDYVPYIPIHAKSSLSRVNASIGYSVHGGTVKDTSNIVVNGGNYGMMPTTPSILPGATQGQHFMYQSGPIGFGNMNSNQYQQILIPNEMVGCIIGKNGCKINQIRQASGSHIKIMDPVGDTNERLVTITGPHERNQMALHMLCSRLESVKSRMM